MTFQPTAQEVDDKLLELAYAWGDVEEALRRHGQASGEGYASLFNMVQKAHHVEVAFSENDFGDPCTPFILHFDVRDSDARSAAATIRQRSTGWNSKGLDYFINEVTDSWHSKYNHEVRLSLPQGPYEGVACRRLGLAHPPGVLSTLDSVPDTRPQSKVDLQRIDGYWLTPLEVPFYKALRETGLFFSVQPWIQGTDRRYRLDFLVFYDGGCIAVELDSFGFHKSKEDFLRDRKRDRWFSDRKVRTLRWAYDEVMADPQSCIRELLDNIREVHARP